MKKVKEYSSRSRIPEDNPTYRFANRLKYQLSLKEMTQTDLAFQMNVTIDTVHNWCQHYSFPDYLHLARLCEIFKPCSVDYFYGLTDDTAPNMDVQSVADYTGLTPAAVTALKQARTEDINVISVLLEHLDPAEQFVPREGSTTNLLNDIHNYFNLSHQTDLLRHAAGKTNERITAIAANDIINSRNAARYTINQDATKLLEHVSKAYAENNLSGTTYHHNCNGRSVIISDKGVTVI